MKTWIAFWNILKKDIQNYYLKPPNISWGIIFPLSWTLMQLIRSSGGMNMSDIRICFRPYGHEVLLAPPLCWP